MFYSKSVITARSGMPYCITKGRSVTRKSTYEPIRTGPSKGIQTIGNILEKAAHIRDSRVSGTHNAREYSPFIASTAKRKLNGRHLTTHLTSWSHYSYQML